MLNRSGYTRHGHYGSYLEYNVRDAVGNIEVGGGVVIFFGGGGVREKGSSSDPPPLNPIWLRVWSLRTLTAN